MIADEILAKMDRAIIELETEGFESTAIELSKARAAVAAGLGDTVCCPNCENVLFGYREPLPQAVFPTHSGSDITSNE